MTEKQRANKRRKYPNVREAALAELKRLGKSRDTEQAHIHADNLMVGYVKIFDPELAEAFDRVPKWYS